MGLTVCRTVPLAPARPARPGGKVRVWCDGVRVARVRPMERGRLSALRSSRAAVPVSAAISLVLFVSFSYAVSSCLPFRVRAFRSSSLLSSGPRCVFPFVAAILASLRPRVLPPPSFHRSHSCVPPVVPPFRCSCEDRHAYLYRASFCPHAVVPRCCPLHVRPGFSVRPPCPAPPLRFVVLWLWAPALWPFPRLRGSPFLFVVPPVCTVLLRGLCAPSRRPLGRATSPSCSRSALSLALRPLRPLLARFALFVPWSGGLC